MRCLVLFSGGEEEELWLAVLEVRVCSICGDFDFDLESFFSDMLDAL